MGELTGLFQFVDVGATGILVVVVMMILTDRLVTKARLKEKEEECERWWHAYENERNARQEDAKQTKRLADATETLARDQAQLSLTTLQSIRDAVNNQ